MEKMLSKKGVITLIVGFLLFGSFLLPVNAIAEKKMFRIGSASLGSSGYIHWEACAFLTNKFATNLKASSLSTAGSTEDVILLNDNIIELGHGTGLEIIAAWAGTKPFNKKIEVWQTFSWTAWNLPMVTLADSNLKTYYDIKGKQASLIKKGSGAESMFRIIFEEYGILKDIKKNYLGWRASMNALADKLIEATPGNFPGGKQHPIMIDLAARKPYRVLELDLEVMKRVSKRNPGILVGMLPKSAYEGLEKDMATPSLSGIGLTTAAVDDDMIYAFCKAVLEHTDELHSISKVSDATTLENSTKWLLPGYPVHPGAVRFFKEKGVWRDDLMIGKR